ncbi:MAG: winged helix-turn-helix transcriptional regulator [Thermoplasmatota archaeon]
MLVEDVILDNPKRSRLYRLISSDPGITFKDLSSRVDFSIGTIQYHLRVLQKKEMIRKEINHGERSYYTFETSSSKSIRDCVGKERGLSALQRKILATITENPEISQNELARALRINRFVLFYHLKCLTDRDLISRRKSGRKVHYRKIDGEEMRRKLLLKLIDEFLLDNIDEDTYQRLKKLI